MFVGVVGGKRNFDVFLKTEKGGKAGIMVVCHDPEWIFGVSRQLHLECGSKKGLGVVEWLKKCGSFRKCHASLFPGLIPLVRVI